MQSSAETPLPQKVEEAAPKEKARRFVFIDALRGFAAAGVVGGHFISTPGLVDVYSSALPWPLLIPLRRGYLGVEIFFVISGFVIAYSMRGQRITAPYLARFAFRRSLRLDPLYWTTLIAMLSLNVLTVRFFPGMTDFDRTFPGLKVVLANAFYLHNLLGVHTIAAASWTLCLEIQFYLLFAVIFGVSQRFSPAVPRRRLGFPAAAYAMLMVPLFLLSLGGAFVPPGWDNGIFLSFWHMFFLGALTWWAIDREVHPAWFWGAVSCELVVSRFGQADLFITAAVVAILIYCVAAVNRLETWTCGRILQFLGKISYSLYLSQGIFGQKIIKLGAHFTGTSRVGAIGWLVIGYAVTMGTAYILYRLVELPTVRLASRFKKDRKANPRELPQTAPLPRPPESPATTG